MGKWITCVFTTTEDEPDASEDREWLGDVLAGPWKTNCYKVRINWNAQIVAWRAMPSVAPWYPAPAGLLTTPYKNLGSLPGSLASKLLGWHSNIYFWRRCIRVKSDRDLTVVLLKYSAEICDVHR